MIGRGVPAGVEVPRSPNPEDIPRDRVVLDASVLLSRDRRLLLAGADLGYYHGYWSSWIASEFARKRTEWIAERAIRDGCDRTELRRRLRESRERVNQLIDEFSRALRSVDYGDAATADLSWLADPDDWPIMQTALAALADVLVTENSRDFPLGQRRNGVLILEPSAFLATLYARIPGAEIAVRQYLEGPSA
jgi:predicted nucleic acid-binding protein